MVVDGSKGVGAFDALASSIWDCAESLAEAAELGAVGGGPCRAEFWVASELAVFQVLAGVRIEDGESPVVKKGGWKTSVGGGLGRYGKRGHEGDTRTSSVGDGFVRRGRRGRGRRCLLESDDWHRRG